MSCAMDIVACSEFAVVDGADLLGLAKKIGKTRVLVLKKNLLLKMAASQL